MDQRPIAMTSTPEGIPGLHLSTDGPIDAEAGAVVEIRSA